MARSHYENFSIGSFLLPRSLRSDLTNIYAFCRLADDIADETLEGVSAFERLDVWERRLDELSKGVAHSPLFDALGDTIARHSLDIGLFHQLLSAFRQDLTVKRYENWSDLDDYCQRSANPMGRLVLAVCGCHDELFFAYSDKICTGLQLANHWQDVKEDYARGRIYIPIRVMKEFEVTEGMIASGQATPAFKKMILHLCDVAENHFREGRALISLVGKPLAPQLYLYHGGGLAAIGSIRQAGGDVLTRKCRVRSKDRIRLARGAFSLWIRQNIAG